MRRVLRPTLSLTVPSSCSFVRSSHTARVTLSHQFSPVVAASIQMAAADLTALLQHNGVTEELIAIL
eukprot:5533188-Amphidinium_carterae.1